MKKILIIISLIIFPITSLFAAEISSNIYVEYGGQRINRESKLNPDSNMNLNTAKYMMLGSVTLKNKFNDSANGVFKLEAKYNPADYIESDEGESIYVKELYIDLINRYFNTRIGKQYMKWGDGVFFNPADVVNVSRDPLRPVSEAEGNPMLHLSIPFGSIAALDLLTIVKDKDTNNKNNEGLNDFSDQPGIIKITTTLGNVSSFAYGYFQQNNKALYGYDINLALALTSETDIYFYSEGIFKGESRRLYIDEAGNLQKKKNDLYYGIVGGFRITSAFPSFKRFDKFTFLCEYYHDNENWSKHEQRNMLNSLILYPDNKSQYVPFKSSKDYLFYNLSISNVFIDYLNIEIGDVFNMRDYSGIVIGSLNYLYNDNTELGVKGNYYYGNSLSEFGNALLNFQILGYIDIAF